MPCPFLSACDKWNRKLHENCFSTRASNTRMIVILYGSARF